MKKLFVIVASLLLAANAHAQFGVIAGITSSSSTIEAAAADVKNISQYHVGITYKLGFGNVFAIQPSLIYNMKGTKIADIASTKAEVDYKTGYLELPVQLQLGMGVGNAFRVYGFAEPFVGMAITNQITGGESKTAEQTWDNVKTRAEYGFSLGAGLELIKHVQLSVKYFWNLGNIYGTQVKMTDINIGEGTCNGIAASVAILF